MMYILRCILLIVVSGLLCPALSSCVSADGNNAEVKEALENDSGKDKERADASSGQSPQASSSQAEESTTSSDTGLLPAAEYSNAEARMLIEKLATDRPLSETELKQAVAMDATGYADVYAQMLHIVRNAASPTQMIEDIDAKQQEFKGKYRYLAQMHKLLLKNENQLPEYLRVKLLQTDKDIKKAIHQIDSLSLQVKGLGAVSFSLGDKYFVL